MQTENNNIILNNEIKPKRKYKERKDKGMKRDIRVPWRHKPDGTYDNNPISESYFKDYYRDKLSIKICCPICNSMIGKQKMCKHQKTKKCRQLQELQN